MAEASGWFEKHGLWMVGLGFLLLILLATIVDMDARLSGYFYDPTAASQWFLKTSVPWIWLYRYGELPTGILAIGAGLVWGGSLWRRSWVCYRRACALIVLAVMLGPGLLVNGLLKPLWGRPRPAQRTTVSHEFAPNRSRARSAQEERSRRKAAILFLTANSQAQPTCEMIMPYCP